MNLRYALLALLADGEAHGYELLKRFNERIGPFWHPNIGQVYQLLHELERRGLAARRDVAVGTRVRRVFRMTARGERALGTWLARRPGWPAPLRDEIIVRLLAAERRGAAAVLGLQIAAGVRRGGGVPRRRVRHAAARARGGAGPGGGAPPLDRPLPHRLRHRPRRPRLVNALEPDARVSLSASAASGRAQRAGSGGPRRASPDGGEGRSPSRS